MDTTAPRQAGVESRPLAGRTAIVTGSTSGIGLGIAHTLAASGAVVVLNGHGDSATIEDLRVAIEAEHHVTATKILRI